MTDQDQIKLYKDQIERTIDINRVISVVLRRWYVLMITITVALGVAFLILRYTKPLYTASIQLKIEDYDTEEVNPRLMPSYTNDSLSYRVPMNLK